MLRTSSPPLFGNGDLSPDDGGVEMAWSTSYAVRRVFVANPHVVAKVVGMLHEPADRFSPVAWKLGQRVRLSLRGPESGQSTFGQTLPVRRLVVASFPSRI